MEQDNEHFSKEKNDTQNKLPPLPVKQIAILIAGIGLAWGVWHYSGSVIDYIKKPAPVAVAPVEPVAAEPVQVPVVPAPVAPVVAKVKVKKVKTIKPVPAFPTSIYAEPVAAKPAHAPVAKPAPAPVAAPAPATDLDKASDLFDAFKKSVATPKTEATCSPQQKAMNQC